MFNGISTFRRLFNAKAILLKEQYWYNLTHSWEDKGVRTFPEGICSKVNVIAQLEYELAYYNSAVHRFNHYTTRQSLYKYIDQIRSFLIWQCSYTIHICWPHPHKNVMWMNVNCVGLSFCEVCEIWQVYRWKMKVIY